MWHRKLIFRLLIVVILVMPVILVGCASALEKIPDPIETIPYDEITPTINGQHHYLLLCQDTWAEHMKLGNTDGIVIVTLDTLAHRVMLTSIIRDALVERPDGVIGRINYIAKNYSPEDLCRVISQHLDIKIEKYILFNFSHIQDIVDLLGGVDIYITPSESTYLTRYAIPTNSTTPRMYAGDSGVFHFRGHSAVIYMRIRKAGGGGDFMRTQRVRTVLSTLADNCRNITYEEATALVNSIMEKNSRTNMNIEEMMQAMDQAFQLRDCTVEELRIPIDGATTSIKYAGMAVQEIDWIACREAMSDYLQHSFLVIDTEEDDDEF